MDNISKEINDVIKSGDLNSLLSLADTYFKKDKFKIAYKLYSIAAKRNNAFGQFMIGFFHLEGLTGEIDYTEAFKWFILAEYNGNIEAKCKLGQMYFYGLGIKVNYKKAFDLLSEFNKHYEEISDSQEFWYKLRYFYELGYLYRYGLGTRPDIFSACEDYFAWASENGNQDADFEIAYCHQHGVIYVKDIARAIEEYEFLAEHGLLKAQEQLANIYLKGIDAETDYNKAFKWFSEAAAQGSSEALYELGQLYLTGKGCEKNIDTALELFLDAFEKGNKKAKTALKILFGLLPNNNA